MNNIHRNKRSTQSNTTDWQAWSKPPTADATEPVRPQPDRRVRTQRIKTVKWCNGHELYKTVPKEFRSKRHLLFAPPYNQRKRGQKFLMDFGVMLELMENNLDALKEHEDGTATCYICNGHASAETVLNLRDRKNRTAASMADSESFDALVAQFHRETLTALLRLDQLGVDA
tara:strand:+ start:393 stop:908 length:516 start_codon:yes stop_codon:yes gene_type:complete